MFNFNPENKPESYTEGFLGDIIGGITKEDQEQKAKNRLEREDDTLGSVSRTVGSINNARKSIGINNKSIVARAKNSILQFPLYVSQSIRVNEAQVIGKLFERVYATFVQTVLSQNPIIDEEEVNNLKFLKNFHTNLKESAPSFFNEYYEPIDELDAMLTESVYYHEKLSDNVSVTYRAIPTIDKDLIAENARLLNDPLTGFSYLREATTKSDSTTRNQTSYTPLSDQELEDIACDRANIDAETKRRARRTDEELRRLAQDEHDRNDSRDDYNSSLEGLKEERDLARETIDNAVEELKNAVRRSNRPVDGIIFHNGRFCRANTTSTKETKGETTVSTPKAPILLKDADIKKFNGMLPYTIEATFNVRQRDGNITKDVSYIIGIKSVMHLVRSQDLEEDLEEIITGNIKSLQKVRYKTGEITFAEYLLNRKNIKADAVKGIKHNKRWINTLKRLSEYDKLSGSLLKHPAEFVANGSVPIPNGTLILSQIDVNNMANNTGIDISEVGTAKKLAKSLFLIGIVIVDATEGSMKVLFPDSDTNWDIQSLASIDAEVAKTDNSSLMKELQKAINK